MSPAGLPRNLSRKRKLFPIFACHLGRGGLPKRVISPLCENPHFSTHEGIQSGLHVCPSLSDALERLSVFAAPSSTSFVENLPLAWNRWQSWIIRSRRGPRGVQNLRHLKGVIHLRNERGDSMKNFASIFANRRLKSVLGVELRRAFLRFK